MNTTLPYICVTAVSSAGNFLLLETEVLAGMTGVFSMSPAVSGRVLRYDSMSPRVVLDLREVLGVTMRAGSAALARTFCVGAFEGAGFRAPFFFGRLATG